MMPAIEFHQIPDEARRPSASGPVAQGIAGAGMWQRSRECRFLDSPYGYVDAAAPFWWPGDADSSSAMPPPLDAPMDDSHGFVSTTEQALLIVHTLGFSKRQLAEVFGVSRQAIYDWIKGGNVSEENAERLSRLARLVAEISADSRRPLHHRFTTRPLAEGEPSLLDLLSAASWDEDRILAQLRRARRLTAQQTVRQAPKRVRGSREQGDDNLLDNLLSLGEG